MSFLFDKLGGNGAEAAREADVRAVAERLARLVPGARVRFGELPEDARRAGAVAMFDRRTGEATVAPGASLADAVHELGGHAVRLWAERNSPELLRRTLEYVRAAPREVKEFVFRNYGDFAPDALVDEIFAQRFAREHADGFRRLLAEGTGPRRWWTNVANAVRGVFSRAARENGVDLARLRGLGAEEYVAGVAEQLAAGRALGGRGGAEAAGDGGARYAVARDEADAAARREYDGVVARYTNADGTRKPGWMKAPNGKPTNLAERQWVQARTPAFKRWFGDWENDPANASKAVDANGEPLVVYHGTNATEDAETWNARTRTYDTEYRKFTVFRRDAAGGRNAGHFFSDSVDVAGSMGGEVYAVHLAMRNPLVVDAQGRTWGAIPFEGGLKDANEVAAYAEADGHDGLILRNVRDGAGVGEMDRPATDYVVFGSRQVKSATDNAGAFDAANPDIRFSIGRLYTGSAADYERPSLHFVGTGEGSQVYGWGLYASDRRGVAEKYARTTKKKAEKAARLFYLVDGVRISDAEVAKSEGYETADGLGMVAKGHGRAEVADYFDDLAKSQSNPDRAASLRKAARYLRDHEIVFEKQSAPAENVYEQTFFTDRAPGDESHLLKWYEPVSEEQLTGIGDGASRLAVRKLPSGALNVGFERDGRFTPIGVEFANGLTGGKLYGMVAKSLGSPKAASEFLARAGIDGVKYPADSYGGKGVKDGDEAGWNYASFRDDNIRVDHKWTDGEQRFSVARAENDAWNGILDRYERGEVRPGEHLTVLGRAPSVLRSVGVPDLPVRVDKQILDKVVGLVRTKSGERHGVPVSELRGLQLELDNPIAVFDSASRPDSVVVLTRIIDRQNNERAVVSLLMDAKQGALDVNAITSIYGKDRGAFGRWIADGRLRYVNKQARKSSARWLQLPSDSDLRARQVLTEKDFPSEQLGEIVPQPPRGAQGETPPATDGGVRFSRPRHPLDDALPERLRYMDRERGAKERAAFEYARNMADRYAPVREAVRDALAANGADAKEADRAALASAASPYHAKRVQGGHAERDMARARAIEADLAGDVAALGRRAAASWGGSTTSSASTTSTAPDSSTRPRAGGWRGPTGRTGCRSPTTSPRTAWTTTPPPRSRTRSRGRGGAT